MTAEVIGEIPPEFQTTGVDGALFTVGVAEAKQEPASVRIFRMDHAAFERFLVQYPRPETTMAYLLPLLERFDPEIDSRLVHFSGTDVANIDEIVGWWGSNVPVDYFAVGPDASLPSGGATPAAWETHAAIIQEKLGFDRLHPLDETKWSLGDVEAVYILTRADG